MATDLTVQAPNGASFVWDEVKTNKGAESLGEVPLLVWNDLQSAVDFYTEEGIINVLDGTSLRVSFQSIARRLKAAGKSDNEIADAQVKFRPGKRAGGVSTPVSRAARAAKTAAEKNPEQADQIQKLLEAVASGADISALLTAAGVQQ